MTTDATDSGDRYSEKREDNQPEVLPPKTGGAPDTPESDRDGYRRENDPSADATIDSHPLHAEADPEDDTPTKPPAARQHGKVKNLTHILKDEGHDDYNEILQLIEADLKSMARYKMKQEHPSATYDGDDLFTEAALKICGIPKSHWRNTDHFLNTFWLIMKRTLINRANQAKAECRGGQDKRKNEVRLDEHAEEKVPSPQPDPHQPGNHGISRLALDQVLAKLKEENPVTGRVADLRFFQGYTIEEIAQDLEISTANVNRRIVYARRFFEWHLRL